MSTTTAPSIILPGVDGDVVCDVTPFPSGEYGVALAPLTRWEASNGTPSRQERPVVIVVQCVKGRWFSTPARHIAATIANLADGERLAIDFGAGWSLDVEDTAAHRAFARSIIAGGAR